MHNPNTALATARDANPSHHGIMTLTPAAVNNVTIYVTVLLTLKQSVITPERMRPMMLVTPTSEIRAAASVVERARVTARSGMYVIGTD